MPSDEFLILHKRDPNFYTHPAVEHTVAYLAQNGEEIPPHAESKIEAFVGFLANKDYVNDGVLTGDRLSLALQTGEHVVKPGEIGESYFDLQRRVALEQGFGNIAITTEMRTELTDAVIGAQNESLSQWTSYLASKDAIYPDWFKTYAFNSVVKLAELDDVKGAFNRRSKGTAAPFPDLNPEALSRTYELICQAHNSAIDTKAPDMNAELEKRARSANFAKLYGYVYQIQLAAAQEKRATTVGSWVCHKKSQQQSDAEVLANSLKPYGTTWCTATTGTAMRQLSVGDFYVYSAADEEGNHAIPRIAVRMARGKVVEVRGVARRQGMEDSMLDIAAEKLSSLPGGSTYNKRVEDMKHVTEISQKVAKMEALSVDDIEFLYGFNGPIDSFSMNSQGDPRVAQILAGRSKSMDYQALLNHHGQEKFIQLMSKKQSGAYELIEMMQRFEKGSIDHDYVAEGILKNNPILFLNNRSMFDLRRITPLDEALLISESDDGSYVLDDNFNSIFKRLQSPQEKQIFLDRLVETKSYPVLFTRLQHIKMQPDGILKLVNVAVKEGNASLLTSSFKYLAETLGDHTIYDILLEAGEVDFIVRLQKRFSPGLLDAESLLHAAFSLEKGGLSAIEFAAKEFGKESVYKACLKNRRADILVALRQNPHIMLTKPEMKQLAQVLCEQGNISKMPGVFNFSQIPAEYHQEYAEAMLAKQRYYPAIIRALGTAKLSEAFLTQVYSSITETFVDKGSWHYYEQGNTLKALIIHRDKLDPKMIDLKKVTDLAMKHGFYELLANHSAKFTSEELDIDALARKLQEMGLDDLVMRKLTLKDINSLDKRPPVRIPQGLSDNEIRQGIKNMITNTPDLYSLTEQLIVTGRGYIFEENIKEFVKAARYKSDYLEFVTGLGFEHIVGPFERHIEPAENI